MIVGYVTGQALTVDTPVIASDSVNYLEARFVFLNRDWDGLEIHAIFDDGDVAYACSLRDGRVAQDSGLNLGAGTWRVHLVGSAMDGDVVVRRITTNPASFEVVCAGRMDGEPVPPARYTDIEEIEAALAKKIDAPQTAKVGEVLTVEEVDADGKPTKWRTGEAAAGQVQADWAQNDSTAADYVKNRPGGYYGDPVATEVEVYVGTLANQTQIEEMKALVAGQEYSVYIDGGEKQTFVAFDDDFEGMACVTIGTKSIMEALETDDAWAIAYADNGTRSGGLMVAGTTNYDGKSIVVTTTEYAREAHKIPLALLETLPEKEQIFVVTPTEQYNETTYYASATFQEILKAVQDGLTVQLRVGGVSYELTSMDGSWAYFHSFYMHTMLSASIENNYLHLYDDYKLGKDELTYAVTSTYTALYDLNAFDQTFSAVRTRMKFFITIRLLTTTAGSYVQMRYYKGTKTLNLCKHEDIGANKPVVLYGELERTEANDTTFITTLRLLNEDGTPHASGFYYCGELDLASDKSYEGPKIEILSGTEDKFASRQSVKKYYR